VSGEQIKPPEGWCLLSPRALVRRSVNEDGTPRGFRGQRPGDELEQIPFFVRLTSVLMFIN